MTYTPSPSSPLVQLADVGRAFDQPDGKSFVVRHTSVSVRRGEVVVLMGPNGSGKSTLLRMLLGLSLPDEGAVQLSIRPAQIGVVMQDYWRSLCPWLRTFDNIALPLVSSFKRDADRQKVVKERMERAGVTLPMSAYPYEMSGGQRQLLCLVRALITQPALLVLDEPMSSLDQEKRRTVRRIVMDYVRDSNAGAMVVSHDLDEALLIADRLLIMTGRPARVNEVAAIPQSVQRTPAFLLSDVAADIRQRVWASTL